MWFEWDEIFKWSYNLDSMITMIKKKREPPNTSIKCFMVYELINAANFRAVQGFGDVWAAGFLGD